MYPQPVGRSMSDWVKEAVCHYYCTNIITFRRLQIIIIVIVIIIRHKQDVA